MKVNLLYGDGDVLDTHLNINQFAKNPDGQKIIKGDISNIDKYVDDSELEELVAIDVIDYMPIKEAPKVIENWARKIRLGGKIILGGSDLTEICKSFSECKIDISEANQLIHGTQDKPYLTKKFTFTAIGLLDYLREKFGFHILKKIVNNYSMIVEAQRR